MRLGLFLTTLIGLAGASHISSAADATWIAVSTLENPACATQFGGPPLWRNGEGNHDDVRPLQRHFPLSVQRHSRRLLMRDITNSWA